jgi:L,D-transpeptidase ErfK/SrfK
MVLASRFLRLTPPQYMQGPDVMAVQRRLIALGFYTGAFNGIYDAATHQGVINFQSKNGLKADGIVGPMTWTALGIGEVQWGGGRYHIGIDTQRNILSLYDQGRISATFPVATGKPSTPTPLGDWVIIEKLPDPGGPFGTAWMRLSVPSGGFAIHGNDDPASIGTSVSHGCIRMKNADATELYNTVPLGTLVTITGQMVTTRLLHLYVAPGADIAELQRMLPVLGYYSGPINGTYDLTTEAAVRRFQQDHQLTPDGIVGPQTAVAIQAHYDIALGDVRP